MMKTSGWLLLIFTVILLSCEKWNLEEQVFLQVDIFDPETLSIDSVSLSATLRDYTGGQVQSHGFIWTTSDQPPTIVSIEGIIDLQVKTREEADLTFSATIQLEPNKEYLLRAFASLDGTEYIYSDAISYKTGNAMVFSENFSYEGGLFLQAKGSLSGMDKGFVALEHGFCWSTENPLPTREDEFVNLGERRTNEPFIGELGPLVNDALHYIRAYAVVIKDFELEILYGEVIEFNGDLEFWTLLASYPGLGVRGNIGFTIGNKGYLGLGANESFETEKDFWEYDPQTKVWTQKADFAGGFRTAPVSFVIGDKGYVGLGFGDSNGLDFWEYDPQTDAWTRKADFPGDPRVYATGFSIGEKGYVGTGTDGNFIGYADFWEYDPKMDSWTIKAGFEGGIRLGAIGFSINGKGYLGTGGYRTPSSFEYYNDFWEYDPSLDTWTQKADFGGGSRAFAASFTIQNLGFIACGSNRFCNRDLWSYDPESDQWFKKLDFPLPEGPTDLVAFSVGGKAYLGNGSCDSDNPTGFWKYDP